MSALSINSLEFTFENHSIRTIIIENEPWFVAVDVCNTLHKEHYGFIKGFR